MKAKKDNIKKTKKTLSKDAKKIITAGVVFFVLFSIILGVKIGTNYIVRDSTNFKKVLSTAVSVMPKSVEVQTNSGTMEFYLEKSDEFDTMFDEAYNKETKSYDLQKISLPRALNFYYYDAENKRVNISDGQYKTSVDDIWIIGEFIEEYNHVIDTANSIYSGFLVALVAGFIIYLIYIWYKAWSVKEDKRIAELKELNAPKKKDNDEE